MLTKKQLTLLEPFTQNVFKEWTLTEIKERAQEKSNNALHLAILRFKEENLITERVVGRSHLVSLNLNNDLIYSYIAIINHFKISNHIRFPL